MPHVVIAIVMRGAATGVMDEKGCFFSDTLFRQGLNAS
jgi:hypothetical protein